jgi:hypothetical protein
MGEPLAIPETVLEEAARLIYGGFGPVSTIGWERVDATLKRKWEGVAQVVVRGLLDKWGATVEWEHPAKASASRHRVVTAWP